MDWIPHVSLGPFLIGAHIASADRFGRFHESESEHDVLTGLVSHVSQDECTRLEVREGIIESVSSELDFRYAGDNLIGRTFQDVEAMLGEKADEVDPEDFSEDPVIVDFSRHGLQLVINRGIITSATCY